MDKSCNSHEKDLCAWPSITPQNALRSHHFFQRMHAPKISRLLRSLSEPLATLNTIKNHGNCKENPRSRKEDRRRGTGR